MSFSAKLACILVLSALAIHPLLVAAPSPATGAHPSVQQPEEETYNERYMRLRKAIRRGSEEVERLLETSNPAAAEAAVKKWEAEIDQIETLAGFGFRERIKIGDHHFEQGNKTEALRLYRSAKPDSWCGNCQFGQRYRRATRVARVYDSCGCFPASFLLYLKLLPDAMFFGGVISLLWKLWYSWAASILPPALLALLVVLAMRRITRSSRSRKSQSGSQDSK